MVSAITILMLTYGVYYHYTNVNIWCDFHYLTPRTVVAPTYIHVFVGLRFLFEDVLSGVYYCVFV